jgi:membrane protein YdbS with pleckstrin-like domain
VPTIVLGLTVASLTYFEYRELESWQSLALNIAAGILIFFAWMLPVVRQLMTTVEVSTAGLVTRTGLFGQKRREIDWRQVSAVEASRGGRMTVFLYGEQPLVLAGLPKSKHLVREMQDLIRG